MTLLMVLSVVVLCMLSMYHENTHVYKYFLVRHGVTS